MRKRIISFLTSLVMVISLVSVVPSMTASAENDEIPLYENEIFHNYANTLMNEFYATPEIKNAEDVCDEIMESYTEFDSTYVAIYKAILDHTKLNITNLLSSIGYSESYEKQLRKKSANQFLVESLNLDTELLDSINVVNQSLGSAKRIVKTSEDFKKILKNDSKCGMSSKDIDEYAKKLENSKSKINKHWNTSIKIANDLSKVFKFGIETYSLYQIQLTYVEKIMNSLDSNSALFKDLDCIRDDMTQNPVKYIIDHFIKDTTIEIIAKNADKWMDEKLIPYMGVVQFTMDVLVSTLSPYGDFDNVVIAYYLNSYTDSLYQSCANVAKRVIKDGADSYDINSFKFRYNQYIAALKVKVSNSKQIIQKGDDSLKKLCDKSYKDLNGWGSDTYLEYLYKKATGHNHSYGSWNIIKAATCSEKGLKTRKCVCGKIEKSYIPIKAHCLTSWSTIKKSTCDKSGTQSRKCVNCGMTEIRYVNAKGHNYKSVTVKSTYFTKGYTQQKCSTCNKISNKKSLSLLTMSAPKSSGSTTNSIKLTWGKVSGAKGYVVYQKKSGKWSRIKTTTATSYTVQKLKSGTTYQFCIKPYKISGGKYVYGNSSKTLSKTTSYMTYSKYKYKLIGSNVEITKYTGKESNVTIPKTIKGKKVAYIGSKAFAGNNNLKSIVIPSNVTTIKNSAFDSCKNLSKVTIQSGVKKIEYSAFNMCLKLKSIKIPKSVTSMGNECVGFAINEKYHSMDLNYTDKFRIYCYKNSAAHKYAKNMGLKYSIIK